MADRPTDFGPNILSKGKGKAPAIDLDQHNDDSSSNDRSRDQSALFVTPVPQATGSSLPRQRVPERRKATQIMADMREGRAAKRVRTAASTPGQSAGPSRPSIEEVEDQGDEQIDHSGHHGYRAMAGQLGNQTQVTSNAPGNKANAGPSRIATDPLQGLRNAQSVAGGPGPQAPPSLQPTNTPVDLTEGDDGDEDGDRVPPGHHRLRRTNITEPLSEFGRVIRMRCSKECEAAASTLSKRTDDEGKQIFLRCVGTATLLKSAKTLVAVRKIMMVDVNDVLVDAKNTLSRRRDKYNRYYEGEDDGLQKLDLKRMLDRQDAHVERVEQAQNFCRDLVCDLRNMNLALLRRNILNDR